MTEHLSIEDLDAVSGGWINIGVINSSQQRDLAPIVAAAKGMDTTGGIYAGNTATTEGGPLGNPLA
jgi:hypothetical protein